ncbi:MAG TPA: hypothetical protein DEU93_10355 [Chitinophagaceae bacterium]|nr:hypothetical protein [Chitinophagaceae bacterium]HML57349.1 hypothetical protein [Ferruginibacter sp.]
MEMNHSSLPDPLDSSSRKPADPDDHIHSEPSDAPSLDPDEMVRAFPPEPELKGMEDPDDLIHPPAEPDPDEQG